MNYLEELKYTIRQRIINKGKFSIRYPKYRICYGKSIPRFYTLIHVNPQEIEGFVYPGFFRDGRFPRVEGGDWDQNYQSQTIREYSSESDRGIFQLDNYDVYTSLYDHYVNGVNWQETDYYSIALSRIRNGDCWHNCTNKEDLCTFFSSLDDIYHDIKSNGYKTAHERGRHISEEVTVDIGRDGELLMDDGRHRLCIAKILGLEKLPVWVLIRHTEWLEKRRTYAYSDEQPKSYLRDHPDILFESNN